MKTDFHHVDEKEGSRAKRILQWVVLIGILAGTVYFGIRSQRLGEDTVKFKIFLLLFIFVIFVKMLFFPLNLYIHITYQKYIEAPDPSESSLFSTLDYMRGKPGRLLWDLTVGIITIMSAFSVFRVGRLHFKPMLFSFIFMAGALLIGHFAWTLYYKMSSNQKRLIRVTEKFMTIQNEAHFVETLEKSLKYELLFRSRQFILTNHFVLGYSSSDGSFQPAAIPREEVKEAEFYTLLKAGKVPVEKGILACKLKNDKVIEFYTGKGPGNEIITKALDSCGFDYKKRADAPH